MSSVSIKGDLSLGSSSSPSSSQSGCRDRVGLVTALSAIIHHDHAMCAASSPAGAMTTGAADEPICSSELLLGPDPISSERPAAAGQTGPTPVKYGSRHYYVHKRTPTCEADYCQFSRSTSEPFPRRERILITGGGGYVGLRSVIRQAAKLTLLCMPVCSSVNQAVCWCVCGWSVQISACECYADGHSQANV